MKLVPISSLYSHKSYPLNQPFNAPVPSTAILYPGVKIGVEIEVEACAFQQSATALQLIEWQKYWHGKEDFSLRNHGTEFVTIRGMESQWLPDALDSLNAMFTKAFPKHDFNYRTGTHVHLNVREFTCEDLLNFVLLYTLFENTLFYISGNRTKNIFCVPIRGSLSNIEEFLRMEKVAEAKVGSQLINAVNNMSKYMACNLLTIQQFGSVELRHHEGTADKDKLVYWLNVLLSLHHFASHYSYEELKKSIFALNTISHYKEMIRQIFPKLHTKLPTDLMVRDMKAGSTFIKELYVTLEN